MGREAEAGRRENFRTDLLLGFPRERQDSVNSLGLATLNNFGGLYTIGVLCSCPAPGPWVIKAVLPPGIYGPDGGCVAPDGFVCIRGRSRVLAVSKNWSAPEGAVSPTKNSESLLRMSKRHTI